MEPRSRRQVLEAGVCALAFAGGLPRVFAAEPAREYLCPPCGCGRCSDVSGKPGSCPACGMRLVEKGSVDASGQGTAVRVAVLLFDGVQVIDFSAPFEVFGQAGYQVFTVAAEARPIQAAMGLTVTPRYSFANAPEPQVVMVPGGDVQTAQADPRVLEWLRARSRSAVHVLSVCNGAFILARAGLLQGLQATTFYDLLDALRDEAPGTRVVSDRRFVDNGQVITAAGLSSGIDGALHVVSRISGPGRAQLTALNMEYDWKPDGQYARASFADAPIRRLFGRGLRLDLPAPERAEVASTSGDRRRWEVVWTLATERTPEQVRDGVAASIDAQGTWTRTRGAGPAWTFVEAGSKGRAALEASAGSAVRIALRVERDAA